MAGFPLRNQREAERRTALAKAVQLLTEDHRKLPANWRHMDKPDRIEWLFGCSLDLAAEILAVPLAAMDQGMLAAADRVRHDLWTIMMRMGIEDRRGKERAAALAALANEVAQQRQA